MQTALPPPTRSIDRQQQQSRNDDRLFKNIRLTEADLDAAHAVRDSTKNTQLPYHSPFLFRTTVTPHSALPAMPASAVSRSKAAIDNTDKPLPAIPPQHQTAGSTLPKRPRAIRNRPTAAVSLSSWRPNNDPVMSPRTMNSFGLPPIPESDVVIIQSSFSGVKKVSSKKTTGPIWANWTK